MASQLREAFFVANMGKFVANDACFPLLSLI